MLCTMTYRFASVRLLVFAVIWLCGSGSLLAQTYNTIYIFGAGGSPRGTLVEGTDGNLYGTTYGGGVVGGMIFKITPGGTFTTLHSGVERFQVGLTLGTDGNFYGTSSTSVFRITPGGTFTNLYTFGPPPDGRLPRTLVQASDGNFYGTTLQGGTKGGGILFRMTPSGALTRIYNFCSRHGCADGTAPLGLIQGTDGNLYGVTGGGGTAGGYGTIFKSTTTGTLTTLHSFDLTDGSGPTGLVQASDGNFYGTTNSGGLSNSNCGGGNTPGTCGTVFKITPTGAFTTLHLFNLTDGTAPAAPPIQASDGNLYGTTSGGGTPGFGTIFKITLTGTLTTVYNLDPKSGDGMNPYGLVQHTNGIFYGPTVSGGKIVYHFCPAWCGTLFSLSVP
jgi:uncharacterized repeat protein (TIGR03803 family)